MAANREVHYEPEAVTLQGVILRQTFPGRPNYENLAKGDEPEVYWILELAAPVDVGEGHDELDEAERDVRVVQLVFDPTLGKKGYADYKDFVGKGVEVSGILFHSHTAHHKTHVLIRVSEIKRHK